MKSSDPGSRKKTLILRPRLGKLHTPARVLWVVITVVSLWLFFSGLPLLREYSQSQVALDEATLGMLGLTLDFYTNFLMIFEILLMMSFVTVATVLFWLKSNDRTAMVAALGFVLFGAVTSSYVLLMVMQGFDVGATREVITTTLSNIGFVFIFLFFYLFPDGHFAFNWMKSIFVALFLWIGLGYFFPEYSIIYGPFWISIGGQLVVFGIGVYSQVYSYRKLLNPTQRQQTKWLIVGGVAGMIGFGLFEVLQEFLVTPEPSTFNVVFHIGGRFLLWYFPRLFVPFTLGAAVLAYRLWDIDFLLNRSLVYGTSAVVVAAVFGGSLYLISSVTDQSIFAFGVAAVVAGGLFQPAHHGLQRFVDQRFYHIMIDYRKPILELSVDMPAVAFRDFSGLELIGQGGMAEIYRAKHPTTDKQIALKLLPDDLASDPEFRKRFDREAKTIAVLDHPNIVKLIDHGQDQGVYFMVMEYISGKDLGEVLHDRGLFSFDEAMSIIEQVASAMDYAHQQGLVHRDIKPSNIMIEEGGRVVLMDFGITKILDSQTQVTRSGFLGTLDYIAPEQIQASTDVDHKADIYSFGVMVYQMLTGELPFNYNNSGALVMAHLSQPPPNPRDIIEYIPPFAAYAIMRAMAKDPASRFDTAGKFVEALLN